MREKEEDVKESGLILHTADMALPAAEQTTTTNIPAQLNLVEVLFLDMFGFVSAQHLFDKWPVRERRRRLE